MSEDFHRLFAAALETGETAPLAPWLADPAAAQRFAVYRNNVVRGAIEALRSAYPAVDRVVGREFFTPMARAFWVANPPRTQTMTLYGAEFVDFIADYEPAQPLPYLRDVARLDRAWLEAHHAAEAPGLEATALALLDPEALAARTLRLHPSVRLIALGFRVLDFWADNRSGAAIARQTLPEGDAHAVIWRQAGQVRHHQLDPDGYNFFTSLAAGASLAEAAEGTGRAQEPDFAGALLGFGLQSGLFAALED